MRKTLEQPGCHAHIVRAATLRRDQVENLDRPITLPQAMHQAQAVVRLLEQMKEFTVVVTLIRSDGSRQVKHVTLQNYRQDFGVDYRENPRNLFIPYYDTRKGRWYTCRMANIRLI